MTTDVMTTEPGRSTARQPSTAQVVAALVFSAIAAGLAPDPVVTVSAWAEQSRQLSVAETPRPGKWSNDQVPYLVEHVPPYGPPRSGRPAVPAVPGGRKLTGIPLRCHCACRPA